MTHSRCASEGQRAVLERVCSATFPYLWWWWMSGAEAIWQHSPKPIYTRPSRFTRCDTPAERDRGGLRGPYDMQQRRKQ